MSVVVLSPRYCRRLVVRFASCVANEMACKAVLCRRRGTLYTAYLIPLLVAVFSCYVTYHKCIDVSILLHRWHDTIHYSDFFAWPFVANFWFLKNFGSIPFLEEYLCFFGFLIPFLWAFLDWLWAVWFCIGQGYKSETRSTLLLINWRGMAHDSIPTTETSHWINKEIHCATIEWARYNQIEGASMDGGSASNTGISSYQSYLYRLWPSNS